MMNRTRFAALALAMLLISAPLVSSALSTPDLQNQIDALLSQIKTLQEKLADLVKQQSGERSVDPTVSSSPYRICTLLARNLTQGSHGDDVSGLQEFLNGQGYLSSGATGYFGPLTTQAVSRWQASQEIASYGTFGPLSRERLLKVWCQGQQQNGQRFSVSPEKGSAPLAVTFSTWLSGFHINTISYSIDFGDGSSERAADCYAPADACMSPGHNTHTYAVDGTYVATLNKITNTCPDGAQCFVAPMSEVIGKVQVQVGTAATCKPLNYMPVACSDGAQPQTVTDSNGCATGYVCPVANFTPPASCKAWNDGCNECARATPDAPAACTMRACFAAGKGYCKVYFNACEDGSAPAHCPSQTNKPPVISGFSGPTTLALNTVGTWSVQASDPENQSLSYHVTWGDENTYRVAMNSIVPGADSFVQSTTFTHAYASAGVYTVNMTVQDSSGQQAKTSSTVKVGDNNEVCISNHVPACGQPPEPACSHSVPACMIATPGPTTYSDRCALNAAGATFLYKGQCSNSQPVACTADAYQCPNGNWVGRTGSNCQFVCN